MRALRLRTQLVLLVLAASVPLLTFAVGIGAWSAREHQNEVEHGLSHTASALALAVRRELDIGIAMLEAVSGARSLQIGEFEAVYRLVKPVGERFNGWVGVLSPEGDYHLSTLVPYGTPLPRVLRTDAVKQAVETGQPVLTDLGRGGVSGKYIANLLVPVIRGNHPPVVVGLALGPERLAALLAAHADSPDERWTLADGNAQVVARSHEQERHLGGPAPEWMRALGARNGVGHGRGLEGGTVVGAAAAVPGTTWTVGVAVSTQLFAEAWWRAVGSIIVGGAVIVMLALAVTVYFSRRLAQPFSELAEAADAVVAGAAPPPRHGVAVQEVLVLREALVQAGVIAREAAEGRERVAVAEAEARMRAHSEERLQFLVHELDHRVKNVLAAIQGLALQTGRTAESVPRFIAEFQARLVALASVHDLLGSGATTASLRAVIAKTIAPYEDGDRIVVSGDDAEIAPGAATALAMAIHELATNAHKHGALSAPGGHVIITVRVDAHRDPRVAIVWTETGGPAVHRPGRRGFGTRLLEGSLADQLDGAVSLDFAPAGLSCAIEFPLSKAA